MRKILFVASFVSAIIGLFLFTSSSGITGAVTGVYSQAISIIGVTLILTSILILVAGGSLEEYVSTLSFNDRIKRLEPDTKIRAVVVDTSTFSKYNYNQIENLLRGMRPGEVLVPTAVLGQIRGREFRNLIMRNAKVVEGVERYRKIAAYYLQRTEKTLLCEKLLPFVEEQLAGRQLIIDDQMRVYLNQAVRIGRIQFYNPRKDFYPMHFWRDVRAVMNHCELSDTDVEVLASALYQARQKKHAIIAARDNDFQEAIRLIKDENPALGKRIDYVDNKAA